MSFTVRVINEDNDPVGNVDVMLSFTSILRGNTPHATTDFDGRAGFGDYENGEVEVFVDGSSCGDYYYSDGEEITITI